MRRSAAISATGGSSSPGKTKSKDETTESSDQAVESKRIRTSEAIALPPSAAAEEVEVISSAADVVPVFGTMSVMGRCREMEDALFVRTNLCRPEISRRRPVHFFGVYDGHGGPHVNFTNFSCFSLY